MNTLFLWGLVLAASVGAQEYSDYFYPQLNPGLKTNLRRLASRFAQVPRALLEGNYFPTSRSLEDDSDFIGARGNFDDLDKNKQILSEIAPRRLPMQVMEQENDFGPPLPPTQWQMMVAPFTVLLPDVTDYCQCKGLANCGCCVGFFLKPFGLRNNLCMNMTLTRDPYSNSQYMIHNKLHYDTYKIMDISVSEKQPPMACMSVVPFSTLAGCIQLTDIHRDLAEDKWCSCLSVSVQFRDRPMISLPTGCTCIGRPVPPNKKRGLFGIDYSSIFYSLKEMFLG